MAVKCFLKHGIPFQHELDVGMPKRVNMIKVTYVDQRFRLGYKPEMKDYRWVVGVRIKRKNS